MGKQQVVRRLAGALLAIFAYPVLVWFVWYRLVGYSPWTLTVAQGLKLVTGLALIAVLRFGWRHVGLGSADLARAFAVLIPVYALFITVGWVLGQAGYLDGLLLRPQLSAGAILDNWLLTGLGEELLFCGVLFTATADLFSGKRRWLVVLIVALLFAVWHVPGYLAIGHSGGALFGRLALNVSSWLFFGAAYALSGNLWLAALMHANTDYPLSPLVTQQPVMGLLFMALMLVGAWVLGRSSTKSPDQAHNSLIV